MLHEKALKHDLDNKSYVDIWTGKNALMRFIDFNVCFLPSQLIKIHKYSV